LIFTKKFKNIVPAMKTSLLLSIVSMVMAQPAVLSASELEALRARCLEQERQIQDLQNQLQALQGKSTSPATTSPATTSSATYTVRAGDSLEKIARQAGTTPSALAKLNGLTVSSVIHPGQKLKLPAAASSTASAGRAPSPARDASAAKIHKVQPGDTFDGISRKYGVSVANLMAANPGVKATSLRPGQQLKLVATSAATPSTRSATASLPATGTQTISTAPRPTPAAAAKEPTLSPTPEKKIRSVAIEEETTYGEFAAKHGTDTVRLNDLNGLDLSKTTVLARGSELYVPAQP
jgi:LysM repeat protein